MTNLEYIRTCSKEELVHFLCAMSDCSDCVARDHCWYEHTGFNTWLDEDKDDE